MSRASDLTTEQRGIIDVNAILGDLITAHFKDVTERNGQYRAVVTRVAYLALADRGPSLVPDAEHPMPAGANRRKKPGRCCSYCIMADHHRNISELKVRIRSEQAMKASASPASTIANTRPHHA